MGLVQYIHTYTIYIYIYIHTHTKHRHSQQKFLSQIYNKKVHYISVATCLGSEHHSPDAFLIPTILFFLNLWVALLWKYLEFLSPWMAHIARALWNHILVSLSRSSFISFLNPLNRDVLPKHESWEYRILPCKSFFICHAIFGSIVSETTNKDRKSVV